MHLLNNYHFIIIASNVIIRLVTIDCVSNKLIRIIIVSVVVVVISCSILGFILG